MWNLNANSESPIARAYLYFYLADHVAIVGSQRVEQAAAHLETIPSMKAKIAEARANDQKKYPSVYLPDVAGTPHEQALFAAVTVLLESDKPTA